MALANKEAPEPVLPLALPGSAIAPSGLPPALKLDFDTVYADLLRWERFVPFMYLDGKGLVTVGVGFLLKTLADAQKLPFQHAAEARPAMPSEIQAAFAGVSKMQKNRRYSAYKLSPSIELAEAEVKLLAIERLKREFLPALRNYFSEFDSYPEPVRRVLIDLAYNGGARGTARLALAMSVRKRNWSEAARKVPVRGQPQRTQWRRDLLLTAANASLV